MITIQRKGSAYGVKHFVVDDKSDLNLLRKDLLFMGSTAYVINSEEKYVVNGNKNWVLMSTNNSSDWPGEDNPDVEDPTFDTIIYDGGEIL